MPYRIERLRSKTRTAVALACIFLGGVCATFGDISRGPLTLSKVFINDEFLRLDLQQSSPPTAAFPTTGITCPAKHTKGCTIRVETSIEIWDVPSNGTMLEYFSPSQGLPRIIELEATSAHGFPGHRTFQFMIPDVQAGSTVTIDVQLQNLVGTAHAGERVETIELLLK